MKALSTITPTPKNIQELTLNIKKFFEDNTMSIYEPISPRYFRISIGVSKYTLSNWKKNENRKEMFNLIKMYEDLLLGNIEQATISLALTSGKDRTNIIGLLNTLRAYDTHLYVPESRPVNTNADNPEPILINFENKTKPLLKLYEKRKKTNDTK